MNQYNYSEILSRAKQLQKEKLLFWQDGILADQPIDLIGGEELNKTVRAHIYEAIKLIGVPLFCSLHIDQKKQQTFFLFKNLKSNTLIDMKLWHLPKSLKDAHYSFIVVWMDSPERLEFDPDWTYPIVLSKFN